MNLKLVACNLDNTQFLVEANTNDEAINQAIKANLGYALYDEEDQKDIEDPKSYSVKDVDYQVLKGLLMRLFNQPDIFGIIRSVIVFDG